jgi:hypothetical protein
LKNRKYIYDAADAILNIIRYERISASVIEAIYDIAAKRLIPITIVENVFEIPGYLSDYKRASLYGAVIPYTYYS